MSHPQNSPRGLLAKDKIELAAATLTAATITTLTVGDATITDGGTDIQLSTGVDLSAGKRYIRANSTGLVVEPIATKPATDCGACFTLIQNSTGVCLAVNSTGTTWKYLLTTSVQPT
jgi:hypothetical protein